MIGFFTRFICRSSVKVGRRAFYVQIRLRNCVSICVTFTLKIAKVARYIWLVGHTSFSCGMVVVLPKSVIYLCCEYASSIYPSNRIIYLQIKFFILELFSNRRVRHFGLMCLPVWIISAIWTLLLCIWILLN